jgi:hypothetical protein
LKPKYIPKNLKRRADNLGWGIKTYDDSVVWPDVRKMKRPHKTDFVLDPDGDTVFRAHIGSWSTLFDPNYVSFLMRWVPDFSLRVVNKLGPAFVMSGDEIAGLLMPRRY